MLNGGHLVLRDDEVESGELAVNPFPRRIRAGSELGAMVHHLAGGEGEIVDTGLVDDTRLCASGG